MATKTKKKVAATHVPAKMTDVELGCSYVKTGVSSIRAFVPADVDDAMQELLDAAHLKIEEGLDILIEVDLDLREEIKEMTAERDSVTDELKEKEKEFIELTVADIAEHKLSAMGFIHYEAENMIDSDIMEALGVLLQRGRPLDTLRALQALADPAVSRELDSIIDLNEMLR